MKRGRFGDGKGTGKFHDEPAELVVTGLLAVIIEVDCGEHRFEVRFFTRFHQPDRAGAVAQQMHVFASQQSVEPPHWFGLFNDQVKRPGLHQADGLHIFLSGFDLGTCYNFTLQRAEHLLQSGPLSNEHFPFEVELVFGKCLFKGRR